MSHKAAKRARAAERWKKPRGLWQRMRWEPPAHDRGVLGGAAYANGSLITISTLDLAEYPDGKGIGLQWHVSISRPGLPFRRATDAEIARALEDFDLVGAEEDNHEPGRSRHFWQPLDPSHRVDCECKTTEQRVVEPDGHTWSAPQDARECAACELVARGIAVKPCPVHMRAAAHEV